MNLNKCPSCESSSVEFDDSRPETQYVCTSCGTVVEECTTLSNENNTAGTSYIFPNGSNIPAGASNPLRFTHPGLPRGKKQGLEKLEQLASIFNLSREMNKSAKDLFCQAYRFLFLKESISKKLILAGCCVYVVLRQYDRPVIYQDLCKHLDCRPKQFYAVFKLFEKFRGTKVAQQTTDEYVRVVLRDMKIDYKEKFIRKTVEILNVCYECWLVSGQDRRHNVIAAAYIAWKSSDYSQNVKVKLSKFFTMFNFPKELLRVSALRVDDMCSVFIKHAEELPWLENPDIDSKRVFLYVDQVLRHFQSLHDDVMSKERNSANCDVDILGYKTFRPETVYRNTVCSASDVQPPDLASKTDSIDEDISDTEIERYIRTEAEVAEFLKFQRLIRGTAADQSQPQNAE